MKNLIEMTDKEMLKLANREIKQWNDFLVDVTKRIQDKANLTTKKDI